MEATLVLGSNLGEREKNLETALGMLGRRMKMVSVSPALATEAVGFDGLEFLNLAAVFQTDMEPSELLEFCKETERRMGRTDVPEYTEDGKRIYHNRLIDIDILEYGDLIMNTPELTLPHPQIQTRPYVKMLIDNLKKYEKIS